MTDKIADRWERHNEAGRRYFSQGEFAQAEQAFLSAISEARDLGGDDLRLAASLSNLGQLKFRTKELDDAEELFRRALGIRERVLGHEHHDIIPGLNNLAALYYTRGQLDRAEPLFRRALTIAEATGGRDHPDAGMALNNLARLYFRRNDFTSAGPLLLRLLATKEAVLGADHPEVAGILTSLVKVASASGEHDKAERFCRRALLIRVKSLTPTDPAIASTLESLADICAAGGKRDEEASLRARARAIRDGTPLDEIPESGATTDSTFPSVPPTRPPVAPTLRLSVPEPIATLQVDTLPVGAEAASSVRAEEDEWAQFSAQPPRYHGERIASPPIGSERHRSRPTPVDVPVFVERSYWKVGLAAAILVVVIGSWLLFRGGEDESGAGVSDVQAAPSGKRSVSASAVTRGVSAQIPSRPDSVIMRNTVSVPPIVTQSSSGYSSNERTPARSQQALESSEASRRSAPADSEVSLPRVKLEGVGRVLDSITRRADSAKRVLNIKPPPAFGEPPQQM
ncbi:MAG: tetratricopeptide repeat protein [Gemmatimonadaceae bacterium]